MNVEEITMWLKTLNLNEKIPSYIFFIFTLSMHVISVVLLIERTDLRNIYWMPCTARWLNFYLLSIFVTLWNLDYFQPVINRTLYKQICVFLP